MLFLLLESKSNFFGDVENLISFISGVIAIITAIISLIVFLKSRLNKKKFYKALFTDNTIASNKREKYFIKHYVKHNLTLEYSADEDSQIKEGEELSFKTFLQQTVKNDKVKIVIIAGSAGIGKSTLMYNLAFHCRKRLEKDNDTEPTLKNYGILLYKINEEQSLDNVLSEVRDFITKHDKKYNLFLDGLDEVSDLKSNEGGEILKKSLDTLRAGIYKQNLNKIFISLRPEIFESGFKDIKNCLSALEKSGDSGTVLYKVCNFNEKQILAMQRIAKYDKNAKTSHKTRKQNLQKLKIIIKDNPKSVFTYPLILSWADDILSKYNDVDKLKYISWYDALGAVVTKEVEREYKIYSSREGFFNETVDEDIFTAKANDFLAKVALKMALGEGYVYREEALPQKSSNRYDLSGDNKGEQYFTDRLLKYIDRSEQEDNDKPHYEFIHNTIFWRVLANIILDPQTEQKVRKEIIFKYKKDTPLLQYCRQGLWSLYEKKVFPYGDLEYMRIADNGATNKVIECYVKESGVPLEIILSCFYEFNEIKVDDPIRRFDFSQIKEFVEERQLNFSNSPISDISIISKFGKDSFDILDCSHTDIITADIPEFVKEIKFKGCKSLKRITIPDSVKEISERAFLKCTSLESVSIGSGVTVIGYQAFAGTALKSITIPDNVKEIGEGAFIECTSLETVTIGNGVTTIGEHVFDSCKALKSVTIPDNVKEIGKCAFIACASLENISIGNGVKTIGYQAFAGTALKSITIPDNVKEIGEGAFLKCASLENISIGNGVTTIGEHVFDSCKALKSVTIPDNVKEIGKCAFIACASLENISIGNSLTKIGEYAFDGCGSLESVYITDIAAWCNIEFSSDDANPLLYAHNLYLNNELVTEIEIPQGVTAIFADAFSCTSLASIEIPDSVTSIDDSAFNGCLSLESIHVDANNKHYSSQNGILYNKNKTRIIKVPQRQNKVKIPDSVTSLGMFAFFQCRNLENIAVDLNNKHYSSQNGNLYNKNKTILIKCSGARTFVNIPDSVTSIGSGAFLDCTSLESITIPDSVTSIGSDAFLDCISLESITIPDSVTYIGEGAFLGCKSLKSITIPDNVKEIGGLAFLECESLECVTIGNGITKIGTCTFRDCIALKSITIPDNVKEIGDSAFSECKSLECVTIGNGVTKIDWYAFDNCIALKSIIVPESVKEIGARVFLQCTSLESVMLDNGVTTIEVLAFESCTALKSITIPDSVTYIGEEAFDDCAALTSINYEGNMEQWAGITKGKGWLPDNIKCVVYCADGDITENQ